MTVTVTVPVTVPVTVTVTVPVTVTVEKKYHWALGDGAGDRVPVSPHTPNGENVEFALESVNSHDVLKQERDPLREALLTIIRRADAIGDGDEPYITQAKQLLEVKE